MLEALGAIILDASGDDVVKLIPILKISCNSRTQKIPSHRSRCDDIGGSPISVPT